MSKAGPAERIRLLYIVREKFPTHRVDVEVLFGRELLERGHHIDLVMQAGNAGVRPGLHSWHGGTVFVGACDPARGLLHRLRDYLRGFVHELRCMLRLAHADRYDAIQVKDRFLIACFALAVARLRGLQFYYWLSFPFPESWVERGRMGAARYPLLTRLRGVVTHWLLYHWILPRSDHAFLQSECMKEGVIGHGIEARKLSAVPMGIDLCAADVASVPPDSGSSQVTLVYVGAIAAERRLEILVDTLGILRRQGIPAVMLIVGDSALPSDRAALEARAAQLGVSQWLHLTGFLPRDEAFARARAAQIGLSPIFPSATFRVASPTKLVEYLALELPVVANDHPDQRLVLDSSGGGVCVPWGARHFARAVRWLLRLTPEQRRSMAMRGREWVAAHRSYVRIADEVERTYLQLRSTRRPRRCAPSTDPAARESSS